jgi:hypothetical protein
MTTDAVYRLADSAEDKQKILRLRDLVYVHGGGRLEGIADTTGTFDRFDAQADYILAELCGEVVGMVKVVRDSEAGLPCDDVVDLTEFRVGHQLVEIGHLIIRPDVRRHSVDTGLIRLGLLHGIYVFGATRLLGDFFVDGSGGLCGFYRNLGFVALGEPHRDERLVGAPLSLVAGLDFADAAARMLQGTGQPARLLEFFCHR